jgi:nucleotide-binding universal stress UspA family protein
VNSTERERIIRRILVAVDASSHSLAALEAAAELAARFEAELHGLFVEDENLLRLAELPFVEEQVPFSADRRRIERQEVLRELRVLARRLEQAFTALVERQNLRGDFRVARGAVVTELLAAAEEADILFVGKAGRSPRHYHRLGSTTRMALSTAPCSTIVMQHRSSLRPPILVVHDGSAAAQRALTAAAAFRAHEDDPLTILLLAPDLSTVARRREEVTAWLEQSGVPAAIRVLSVANAAALAHTVRMQECGMLILPAVAELLEDEAVQCLLDEIEVPVLLIR